MPNRVYLSEALLQPVGPEQPGGRDLRFEPVFSEILEARRIDDVTGKQPQWDMVAELSLEALQSSKDIRLCCFLTEAGMFLDGFPALRDCLRLTREIVTRFWDQGLLTLIEDGLPVRVAGLV
jgi:type VI secretion system protein ImpA